MVGLSKDEAEVLHLKEQLAERDAQIAGLVTDALRVLKQRDEQLAAAQEEIDKKGREIGYLEEQLRQKTLRVQLLEAELIANTVRNS